MADRRVQPREAGTREQGLHRDAPLDALDHVPDRFLERVCGPELGVPRLGRDDGEAVGVGHEGSRAEAGAGAEHEAGALRLLARRADGGEIVRRDAGGARGDRHVVVDDDGAGEAEIPADPRALDDPVGVGELHGRSVDPAGDGEDGRARGRRSGGALGRSLGERRADRARRVRVSGRRLVGQEPRRGPLLRDQGEAGVGAADVADEDREFEHEQESVPISSSDSLAQPWGSTHRASGPTAHALSSAPPRNRSAASVPLRRCALHIRPGRSLPEHGWLQEHEAPAGRAQNGPLILAIPVRPA
ncbi:hypothetical protein LDDCCGHA_4871 [Methylobacterium oxalidis]|nr:hypothetical protein LDDCCGHA_4871 [Methylobacterium oxalidis]